MIRLILTTAFLVIAIFLIGALIGLGRRAATRRAPGRPDGDKTGGDGNLKA